jgi:hypothetical protein
MVAADPLSMGVHDFSRGRHRLRVSIVGIHPQATPAYTVGIDAIRLERIR